MKTQYKQIWQLNIELSDSKKQVYTHSFPILKDRFTDKPILTGEFIYNKIEGTVFIDVFTSNDGVKYAPFYDNKYGNFVPILNKIITAIQKEMKKVGLQPCQ